MSEGRRKADFTAPCNVPMYVDRVDSFHRRFFRRCSHLRTSSSGEETEENRRNMRCCLFRCAFEMASSPVHSGSDELEVQDVDDECAEVLVPELEEFVLEELEVVVEADGVFRDGADLLSCGRGAGDTTESCAIGERKKDVAASAIGSGSSGTARGIAASWSM
jgi:hypothetical protein